MLGILWGRRGRQRGQSNWGISGGRGGRGRYTVVKYVSSTRDTTTARRTTYVVVLTEGWRRRRGRWLALMVGE